MSQTRRSLRVAIDARVDESRSGGVAQVIIGLAVGLSELTAETETYSFLVEAGRGGWLQRYLGPNSRLLVTAPPSIQRRSLSLIARIVGDRLGRRLRDLHRDHSLVRDGRSAVPKSDGSIERAGIEVMHFAHQWGFLTRVPTIYHPHDLQHIHLPQYFTPSQRLQREITYRSLCEQAQMVAVTASWGKRDLVSQYGLDREKVAVVPLAPVLDSYERPSADDLRRVKDSLRAPEEFVLYPAQTWPHKNHVALLKALALLRRRDNLRISFVGTGAQNDGFRSIKTWIEDLDLADQVQFVGYVSGKDLRCLYTLCRLVCVPTLFEAASFPMWEAFLAGAPVACSNVTSLPEQAGDAALLFPPTDVGAIADSIRRLWSDEGLRQTLASRGRERVAQFTWARTAKHFRAHYRRLGGRDQTEEDAQLLRSAPLL